MVNEAEKKPRKKRGPTDNRVYKPLAEHSAYTKRTTRLSTAIVIERIMLGRRLKFLRNNRRLSIADVSKLIGINRATLGMYELGRLSIRSEVLIKIANAYGVNIDGLLNGTMHILTPDFQGMGIKRRMPGADKIRIDDCINNTDLDPLRMELEIKIPDSK